jgi:hypothetical protein
MTNIDGAIKFEIAVVGEVSGGFSWQLSSVWEPNCNPGRLEIMLDALK